MEAIDNENKNGFELVKKLHDMQGMENTCMIIHKY
jgi:hypothetical protein